MIPSVETILHPTDFSEAGRVAFIHALALAVARRARLILIHADPQAAPGVEWNRFPGVRETLVSWGLLKPGSPSAAVEDTLGVRVQKVEIEGRSPRDAVRRVLRDRPVDLLVVATEGRTGIDAMIRPSVAEEMARAAGILTLFVPQVGGGFVDPATGAPRLRRVLLPVTADPSPADAVEAAAGIAGELEGEPLDATLLHVGNRFPELRLPEVPGVSWHSNLRSGSVVDSILSTAEELPAELVIMVTAGREGILDLVQGSLTERVLRSAGRPVLAVPAPGGA